jgi:hypothetical protein
VRRVEEVVLGFEENRVVLQPRQPVRDGHQVPGRGTYAFEVEMEPAQGKGRCVVDLAGGEAVAAGVDGLGDRLPSPDQPRNSVRGQADRGRGDADTVGFRRPRRGQWARFRAGRLDGDLHPRREG